MFSINILFYTTNNNSCGQSTNHKTNQTKHISLKFTQNKKTDTHYEITLPMVGLEKEDISIKVKKDLILVEVLNETDFMDIEKWYFKAVDLDLDKVKSTLKNGILVITVPVEEEQVIDIE